MPAALGIVLLTVAAAAAQEPPVAAESANIVSYPASFFAESRPSTALDMVRRTPGFTYTGTQQDVRGLTGAIGNVLIDGQLQTSKTVTLDDTLQRIPANQVARVDIVRAGAGGIDMGGFPVVANIVRVAGGQSQTTVQVEPKLYLEGRRSAGTGRVDWSRTIGALKLSSALQVAQTRADDAGEGYLKRFNAAGAVTDEGEFVANYVDKTIALNGAGEYRAGSTLFRSNFGYSHLRSDRNDTAQLRALEWFRVEEDIDRAEFGFNVERTFGSQMAGKIDVLQTFAKKDNLSGPYRSLTETESTEGESNLRGAISYDPSPNVGLEAGVEGAFNFLDQESSLTAANANVRVEERRAQPFVTMNWQVFEPFSVELGARYETSTIKQTGDTNSEARFYFLKPRIIAAWQVFDKTQLRVRYERVARQLDFADFVATQGAQEGANAEGNANLRPEWSWVSEIAVEQRLWPSSTVVVSYQHEEIRDTWDFVPIGTTEGRGNLGDGTRDQITTDIKISLDPLGIRGVRIESNPSYYVSEIHDRITGQTRPISGNKRWRGRTGVFFDRPELNSTFVFEYFYGARVLDFRPARFTMTATQAFGGVSWEWTPAPSIAVRTALNYITGRERPRDRTNYVGSRATGVIASRELRDNDRGPWFSVRLRKTF